MVKKIPAATTLNLILLALGRRIGVEISGDSMRPTLMPGDRVLVNPRAAVGAGDVVLANHPYKSNVRIIKRVRSVNDDGSYFLVGDNARASTDSGAFGVIYAGEILGTVVCRTAYRH